MKKILWYQVSQSSIAKWANKEISVNHIKADTMAALWRMSVDWSQTYTHDMDQYWTPLYILILSIFCKYQGLYNISNWTLDLKEYNTA